MNAVSCPAGTRGFDANAVLTADVAAAFKKIGYRFAVRYVRRTQARSNDLSAAEVDVLHRAGLAVGVVQHVESATSWAPTPDKGQEYGHGAVLACKEIGVPAGVTVWCDLEGVATSIAAKTVAVYCRLWFDQVHAAGYEPGLYVGWHAGLNAEQLYVLPFTKYWGAYNLNVDQRPARVGVCMRQGVAKSGDRPPGISIEIDTDLVTGDLLGRVPCVWAPDEWDIPLTS